MAAELKNAKITHVSYVDKGANKKTFFLTKSAEEPTFTKQVKLYTKSDEQQLVYGVVYEPLVEDAHGDFMTAPEIEKAAHIFLKDARNIDTQHDFQTGVGEVVESYVAPVDFTIGEQLITKGSWVLVTKATEEVWEKIKKGEITGYSMAGIAESIEKQEQAPSAPNEKGLFEVLKDFFTGASIQKGKMRERYEANQKHRNVWAAFDGLEGEFYESLWENHTPDVADFARLKEAAQDFVDILNEIKTEGDVQKALEAKGEEVMKKEEILESLEKALSPISERLEAIEKKMEDPTTEETAGDGEPESGKESSEEVSEAIEKVLAPFVQRLENVEKARGLSNQADGDDPGKPVQKSIWDGLL